MKLKKTIMLFGIKKLMRLLGKIEPMRRSKHEAESVSEAVWQEALRLVEENGATDKRRCLGMMYACRLMEDHDRETCVVGLLHGAIDCSRYTFEGILRAGIPSSVVERLRILQSDEERDYMAYLARVKQDRIATAVKVKELEEALRDRNLTTEKKEKYECALSYLCDREEAVA